MERPDFDDRFDALAAIAYRVAHRILGDRADAEEVAQEALARACVRWRTVRGHAEPWVARVATNLAITRWRKRRPTVPLTDEAGHRTGRPGRGRSPVPGSGSGPGGWSGPDAEATLLERQGLVESLRRLPRRQREVVVLRYIADLPEREVAEALALAIGTVKQHAHRGLARLRAGLSPALAPAEVDHVRSAR